MPNGSSYGAAKNSLAGWDILLIEETPRQGQGGIGCVGGGGGWGVGRQLRLLQNERGTDQEREPETESRALSTDEMYGSPCRQSTCSSVSCSPLSELAKSNQIKILGSFKSCQLSQVCRMKCFLVRSNYYP